MESGKLFDGSFYIDFRRLHLGLGMRPWSEWSHLIQGIQGS